MRLLPTAVAFLFFSVGVTNSASVDVIGIEPSSQNAQITVLLDGKPQKDVKLTITTTDRQPKASLVTDSLGVVRLPTLPPGDYCVTASADPKGPSLIGLAISAHQGKSKFSMIKAPGFETKILLFHVYENAPNHQVRAKMEIGTITDGLLLKDCLKA
jgi:hypothetical protein